MKIIKELVLDGTKNGRIVISTLDEPYGKDSHSVASVAISLSGKSESPDWKIHLPKANIDDVIAALNEAKENL